MEELGAIDTIKKSFDILIDDLGIIILYAMPAIIGFIMAIHIGFTTTAKSFMDPTGMSAFMALLPFIIIYMIALMVVSVIAIAGVTLKVGALQNNTSIELKEAFSGGLGYFIPLALSYIIFFLVSAFGFILLIIPGIYFALRMSLFAPACVLETKDTSCIRRSWGLAKGRIWKILAILFILSIISMVLGFVPFIGALISTLIIRPIQTIALTLVYLDARKAESGELVNTV